jgi:hypothetical protein
VQSSPSASSKASERPPVRFWPSSADPKRPPTDPTSRDEAVATASKHRFSVECRLHNLRYESVTPTHLLVSDLNHGGHAGATYTDSGRFWPTSVGRTGAFDPGAP